MLGRVFFQIDNIVKHIFYPLINRMYKKADLLQLPDHQCDSKNIFVKERKSNWGKISELKNKIIKSII